MTARIAAPLAGLAGFAAVLVFVFWPGDSAARSSAPAGSGSSPSYVVQLTAPADRPAEVVVRRHDGAATRLAAVTLEPAMPQMGHAVPAVLAQRAGADRFTTREALLPMPGRWEVLVLLGEGPDAEFVLVQVE
ncbi:MAG TPA: hypothetical protein VHH34_16140 [Pseudonocardiaceae bacterium]|nr:hypothetical protein [Pseudonocardiaceae bacterium]